MTPEAQRIAIAEACGITNIQDSEPWELWDEPPKIRPMGNLPNGMAVELPDYLNDLNACHEMEKVLIERQKIAGSNMTSNDYGCWTRYVDYLNPAGQFWGGDVHATAAQRCEAFLKTLGLWKE